jgi:hypothetical protein
MPKKSTKQVKECEPESDSGELELLNDDELEEAINNKSSKSESKKVKAKKGEKPIKAVEPLENDDEEEKPKKKKSKKGNESIPKPNKAEKASLSDDSSTKNKPKKGNPWLQFVSDYRAKPKNKDKSYKDVLSLASAEYKKQCKSI